MPEPVLKGDASYPGVSQVIDCTYTCSLGIGPGKAVLTIAPQDVSTVQGRGDVVLNDGSGAVYIKDCTVVDMYAPEGDAGPIVLVLNDGRWQWEFGAVSGRWNQLVDRSQTVPVMDKPLDPNGNQPLTPPPYPPGEEPTIPWTRKTATTLAKILLAAMNVKDYDISALPDQATPPVHWDYANPAVALQQLASDLGCVVAYHPHTGRVVVSQQGVGSLLPDGGVLTESPELKARPRPQSVRMRCHREWVQMRVVLVPAAEDFDGAIRTLDLVSWRPIDGDWSHIGPPHFKGLPSDQFLPGRRRQADAEALARKSLYRYFMPFFYLDPANPSNPDGNNAALDALRKLINKPKGPPQQKWGGKFWDGFGTVIKPNKLAALRREFNRLAGLDGSTVGYMRITPFKCQTTWDDLGRFAQAPAAVYGKHTPPERVKDGADIRQVFAQTDLRTEVKVPFRVVDIGNDDQAVVFEQHVYGLKDDGTVVPPEIVIECACEFQDVNRQYYRSPFDLKLANGPVGKNLQVRPYTFIRDEVRFQRVAVYGDKDEGQNVFTKWTDNKDSIKGRVDYLLKGEARRFQLESAAEISYAGLRPILPDGAIQQVTWSISPPTTRASRNTEHSTYLPNYQGRRDIEENHLEQQRQAKFLINVGVNWRDILNRMRG